MANHNLTTIIGLLLTTTFATAQGVDFVRADVLDKLAWRSLGPARFGGRIVDLAVHPERSSTFYVASASGGLFKTTNHGTTFSPLFQHQSVISIGDIALAPSQPETIYVGTGEANNQRSSYWGNGVFKSTDGGKKWQHIGLEGTDHIGRIVVHPTDPDVVYVAALGALYSPNDERGIYRSVDGGESWVHTKFLSAEVGFVDLVIDPRAPKTLYATSYERRRRAWHFEGDGPGSAIWKSIDAGDSWTKLKGGLPKGEIGRIGLATFAGKDQTIVFACLENGNPRPPGKSDSRRRRRSSTIGGQVFRSADGGKTWQKISGDRAIGGTPGYYYGQIRVDPTDEKRIYVLSVPIHATTDGGKTWKTVGGGVHVDHHALWIDPRNPRHLLLGNDGGLHISYDYGAKWDHMNHLSIGQFYAIAVDLHEPYWIYGGTQDNGTWGIPSRAVRSGGVHNRHAAKISGGDGFFVQVDPLDPTTLYCESQFGRIARVDLQTGARQTINPKAERGSPRLRHNWSSPILLSRHNHHTIYFGSQYLHRSTDRGDTWQTISPDLSTADSARIQGNVPHCTITTIAESPKNPAVLWVGTDDGKVWMTKTGGRRWVDLSPRFAPIPPRLWTSRVEASSADVDVAYVAFTGYREDLRSPFLYLTTDGGESFRSIANDLPEGPINVVREHPRNRDVVFVGTEFGVFVSLNGGGNWHPLDHELPTVACHDLLVHPREMDLIVGTHGRGIFVMDIAPLEDLSDRVLAKTFHAFPVTDGHLQVRSFSRGWIGARTWSAERFDTSAKISYYLRADSSKRVTIRVLDAAGKRLFSRRGRNTAGLHRVSWRVGGSRGRGPRIGNAIARFFAGGGSIREGSYIAELEHGDTVVKKVFRIRGSASTGAASSPAGHR